MKGQEPPKMYMSCTSPGDGQISCKVWLASGEWRRCSNESKTRNPLKFAQNNRTDLSRYYEDMWKRYCCLTSFFRLRIDALVAKIQHDKIVRWWADGEQMAIICVIFCVLYFQRAACSTFQTCGQLRLGEEKKKIEDRRNHRAKNIMSASATQGGHKSHRRET